MTLSLTEDAPPGDVSVLSRARDLLKPLRTPVLSAPVFTLYSHMYSLGGWIHVLIHVFTVVAAVVNNGY